MILRNYDVADLTTGEVVKTGSTYRPLNVRWNSKDYAGNSRYTGCGIFPVCETEWPDEDKEFGILWMRVREQLRTGNYHLWRDERNGDKRSNFDEPVKRWVEGFDWTALAVLGAQNQPHETRVMNNRKAGKRMKEEKRGIFAPGIQAAGGRAAVQVQRENKTGFFSPQAHSREHQIMARKSRDPEEHRKTSQVAGRKRVESGFFSKEHQIAASRKGVLARFLKTVAWG